MSVASLNINRPQSVSQFLGDYYRILLISSGLTEKTISACMQRPGMLFKWEKRKKKSYITSLNNYFELGILLQINLKKLATKPSKIH